MQKKCVRNVAAKGYRSHTDPIFSKLGILKFDDLFSYNCSSFMHKCVNGKVPTSFDNLFPSLAPPNKTNGFIELKTQKKYLEQFPNFFLPKIWNENSLFIKLTESHKIVKKELKKDLSKGYLEHVSRGVG